MSSSLKESLAIPIVLSWSCSLHTALFVWIHPWDLVCDWRQAANCSRATEKEAPISRTNGRQQRFFRCSMTGRAQRSSKLRDEERATDTLILYLVRWAVLIFSVHWRRQEESTKSWEDMTENHGEVPAGYVVLTSKDHPHEIAILRQAKQSAPTSEQTEKVNLLSIFFYENISCPLG